MLDPLFGLKCWDFFVYFRLGVSSNFCLYVAKKIGESSLLDIARWAKFVLSYLIAVENMTTFRAPQNTYVTHEFLTYHQVQRVYLLQVWPRAESGSRKCSAGSRAVRFRTGVAPGLPLGYFPC